MEQLDNIEIIPNEDHVYRNIHVMQSKNWGGDKQPNSTDFALRENETGLSVNWDKYCTPNSIFIMIGTKTVKSGKSYQDPKNFKLTRWRSYFIKFGTKDEVQLS